AGRVVGVAVGVSAVGLGAGVGPSPWPPQPAARAMAADVQRRRSAWRTALVRESGGALPAVIV
ncbi:MAG TPA: hypothetical protein VI789_02330, partial [Dehalococcoidia bacterium]|nr:hypothetical protein [Dehalococcoidia bacterium]